MVNHLAAPFRRGRVVAALLALVTITGCASAPLPRAERMPPPVSFNASAGRGDLLYMPLNVFGRECLFVVDTGSPVTVVDSSFEPKLGPRLGVVRTSYAWYGRANMNLFATPELSIGHTRLVTGETVQTDNLRRRFPRHETMGILGMDVMRHYCVQFDFATRRARFFPSAEAAGHNLGRAFPLSNSGVRAYTELSFLSPSRSRFLVDTGCNIDAVMKPDTFELAVVTQPPLMVKQFRTPGGQAVRGAAFGGGQVAGEPYTNLLVDGASDNFLGLRFLSRHLVTIDFPHRVMYLRPQR